MCVRGKIERKIITVILATPEPVLNTMVDYRKHETGSICQASLRTYRFVCSSVQILALAECYLINCLLGRVMLSLLLCAQ